MQSGWNDNDCDARGVLRGEHAIPLQLGGADKDERPMTEGGKIVLSVSTLPDSSLSILRNISSFGTGSPYIRRFDDCSFVFQHEHDGRYRQRGTNASSDEIVNCPIAKISRVEPPSVFPCRVAVVDVATAANQNACCHHHYPLHHLTFAGRVRCARLHGTVQTISTQYVIATHW